MSKRQASQNLRARIPVLYHQGLLVKEICHRLGIKKSLVYLVLNLHSQFGIISNLYNYSCTVGRPRSLSQADLAFLSTLLDHRRCLYLDELQEELQLKRGVCTTLPTLYRALQWLGVSRKVISACAYERNELVRAMYMNQIAKEVQDAGMLMFVDEAAKDEHTISRRYGHAEKGVRCVVQRCFVRGMRYSIVPVITLDGIIVYNIVDVPVDSDHFFKFIKELVMPFTNPYPGPRSVLIMDNCRIHHGERIRQLVEDEHFCKLIYLPPYSPDYNPIEQAFSTIKAYLCRQGSNDSPMMSIIQACQSITPDKAEGYFWASGYVL